MLLGASQAAFSNGSQLLVQDVTHLGTVYAGTAASATDAGTNFYNPAGLVMIKNPQFVGGANLVIPNIHLDVENVTSTFGTAVPPGTGREIPRGTGAIPFGHYANPINDNWTFGLSVISTFGSKTNYKDTSLVRYVGTVAELYTIDVTPCLAYDFGNGFSLGAGPDIVFTHAKLDFSVGAGSLNTDGYLQNKAHGTAFAYHAGILYQVDDCTRFGFAYHSRMNVRLKGEALNIDPLIPLFGLNGAVTTRDVTTKLNLPDTTTLSGYHAFNDQWAAMADVSWYHWNVYKDLRLDYSNNTSVISPQNWKNSYRVALGGSYQHDCHWQFKAGVSFDKTPTRNETRNTYLPDADYYGLGIGTQYKFNKWMTIDVAYARILYKNTTINLAAPISVNFTQGAQTIRARSKQHVDVVGLQLTWNFV